MVIREDSAAPGGCCALCSSAARGVAATPKMLPAARLRTQSRETRCIESAVIFAARRRQVGAPPQLLRLYRFIDVFILAQFLFPILRCRRRVVSYLGCRAGDRPGRPAMAGGGPTVELGDYEEAETKMRDFQQSLSQNGSSRF